MSLVPFLKFSLHALFQPLLPPLFLRLSICLEALQKYENPHQEESQNHRIVGVGRDLCGSSSPTPLPKQGHLQ